MYIERIVYPVVVLGIGKRIGLWLQGCNHKCDECINPELWQQKENCNLSINTIIKMINDICENNLVDGFTITGGDPFFQIDDLHLLLEQLSSFNKEILVYTGYTIEQIQNFDKYDDIIDKIDILIDGKYIKELNVKNMALRGSSNQNIIYKNEKIKNKYKEYISKGRQLQNFNSLNNILSLGIHDRSFDDG